MQRLGGPRSHAGAWRAIGSYSIGARLA
jgi:hypothetical protein